MSRPFALFWLRVVMKFGVRTLGRPGINSESDATKSVETDEPHNLFPIGLFN
jgi:hypothetical protein